MSKKKGRDVWEEVRTYAVVAIVSALIWLYAEAKTLHSDKFSITVQFVSNNPDLYDVLDAESVVEMQYLCAAGQIPQVRSLPQPYELQLQIEDPGKEDEVERSLSLRQYLVSYEPLAALGVIIERVTEETKTIQVVRLAKEQVDVKPRYDQGQLTDIDIDPKTVSVRLPVSFMSEHKDEFLEVVLDEQVLANRDVNVPHDDVLSVRLPDDWRMPEGFEPQIDPPTVTVKFTIRDLRDAYTLDHVPVKVLMVPDDVGKYTMALSPADRFKTNIEVSGLSADIERLKQQPEEVMVYFSVTDEQLASSQIKGIPQIDLPANIRLDSVLTSVTIDIKLNSGAQLPVGVWPDRENTVLDMTPP